MLNKRGLCQWEIDLEFLRVDYYYDNKESESVITGHKTDRPLRMTGDPALTHLSIGHLFDDDGSL